MRPASSFSFVVLTFSVTLVAWACLAVMMVVFLLWAPFAWLVLKLGSDREDAFDSSSASHAHPLLKQTSILVFLLLPAILANIMR